VTKAKQEEIMKVVEFKYDVGEEVKVKAINVLGKIDSLSFDIQGTMYRVIYWDDGSRNQTWMYDWEIEGREF